MKQVRAVFLGKQGKVFGPFDGEEVETLRASGELKAYTYIWESDSPGWRPLEAPPPNPSTASVTRPGNNSKLPSWANDNAICHDFERIVTGRIENVSPSGCDFVSLERSDYPKLGLGSMLVLEVMDPKQDKATSVQAVLADIRQSAEAWVYRLQWDKSPQL